MKNFMWRPEVKTKKKWLKHIYIYRSNTPRRFGCASLYRFWDLVETMFSFYLVTGNRRPEWILKKWKKNPKHLEVIFNLNYSWKFQETLSSHLWDFLSTKRGKHKKKEKTLRSLYKVFRWKLKTLKNKFITVVF